MSDSSLKPLVLIILDGYGLSPITNGNAVYMAKTPFVDHIFSIANKTSLHAAGVEVGLEWGEMGNSEVGHFNLGTGRIVMQNLTRINSTITDKSFFSNENLISAYSWAKKNNSILHIYGLVSTGGVHSHINHLYALLDLAKSQNIEKVAIHCILDGRDSPPKMAKTYLSSIEEKIKKDGKPGWKIASLVGRFYAMDRDKNWDRIQSAYELICSGKGEKFNNWQDALDEQYKKDQTDENFSPVILEANYVLREDDAMVFFNFRSDRSKQISEAIISPTYKNFSRSKFVQNFLFVSFTSCGQEPSNLTKIAFFAQKIGDQLAMILEKNSIKQFHIAETEKYAHVTYFFNGGREEPFKFEDRLLVPSPKVKSYDTQPEMSAQKLTTGFISYFNKNLPVFTVLNFANPDMVGHTGNLQATIQGIEFLDKCINKIFIELVELSPIILITADHGNAEQMINPQTNEIDKEHTTNPVPFVMINDIKQIMSFKTLNKFSNDDKLIFASSQPAGVLADVTSTVMDYLNIEKPADTTGISLKSIIGSI